MLLEKEVIECYAEDLETQTNPMVSERACRFVPLMNLVERTHFRLRLSHALLPHTLICIAKQFLVSGS